MWWLATVVSAQEPIPQAPEIAPVVVEAPIALTAEERVDEARRRMAAGDWPGTRLVLDEARAMTPGEALLADIAYLEAFSLEMDGAHADALARWDALLARAPTDDVRFRRAETLAALGRVAEAEAALDALGDPATRSPADRTKIDLLRGMWRLQLGDVKGGAAAIDAALTRAPAGEATDVQARARVVLAAAAADAAAGLSFVGSDRKKKKALERRALLVKGVQDQLVLLVRLAHAPSTAQGFLLAMRVYDELGSAMLAETPPRKLTDAQLRLNRELLAGKVQNVWIKASQLGGMGAEWAARVGYTGAAVQVVAARKAEIDLRIEALPLPTVAP